MKDFLEKTLKQTVHISENTELYKKLPLAFYGRYHIYNVETNGLLWIAISPKSETGLVMLRKDRARIENLAKLNCALFLESTTFYIREKLMDEGIPFVIKDKQLYLPFIGYLLAGTSGRKLAPVHLISFLTQRLLFTAIYENWQEVKVSEAAANLSVTKMSVSRCFDEIEYLNISILKMKGKSRVICIPDNVKAFWKEVKGVLRSPVINRYVFKEDLGLEKRAGISALCEYSLLSAPEYPIYAITKKEIIGSQIRDRQQISERDEVGCVVLELGYFIDYEGKQVEDPLSVALSLTDEELRDERIRISTKEMLEEYVWSKG